jgi:serine/threonine protein kinase
MLKPGDRIGDWIIEAQLGEGGMGTVFRVHSALSARVEAALKVMKPSAEADARAAFVREAEALAALRHPAIVRVMGFAEDASRALLYLVMELARGETLRERLARGPMPLAEALRTFLPLAHGLEHAHAAGIYHRDLKPSNVVLTHDGVRLVDFGIAAAAHDAGPGSGHLGTLAYLPPEVFRGDGMRPRDVDVYGFGLLLHEALVGRRMFPIDAGLSVAAAAASVGARKQQQGPLDPGPELPEKLREQVRKATDPDPSRRPDIAEICRALESLVERRGGGASPGERMSIQGVVPPVNADPTIRVPEPLEPRFPSETPTSPIGAAARRPPRVTPPRAHQARRDERRDRSVSPLVLAGIAVAALLVFALALVVGRALGRHRRPAAGVASPTSAGDAGQPPAPRRERSGLPDPRASTAREAAEDARQRPGADVAGAWLVVNRIQATTYAPYRGLRLTYRLRLRQDGQALVGQGEKAYEDGTAIPTEHRTPITVHGRVEGDTVTLAFTEEGALRTSRGRFRWTLVDGRLEGRFASDAAASRGISTATRER